VVSLILIFETVVLLEYHVGIFIVSFYFMKYINPPVDICHRLSILLKSSAVFHNLSHIQLHNYVTLFHDPLTATDPAL